MIKVASFCSALVLVALVSLGQGSAQQSSVADPSRAVVDKYCATCHNDTLKKGGFSFSELDLAHPELNASRAERVIRKIRSGMMPPSGMPRPDLATMKAFAAALETRIDKAAVTRPYTDAPELHRINRREYRNSIRELLDMDVDVAALLPPDSRTGVFDNMSEALTVTPTLMQAYLRAAEKIARDAIGDPKTAPFMTTYNVPRTANQMRHIDGAPFGTRGGTIVTHNFPADGAYSFDVTLYYHYTGELIGSNLPEVLQGQELEISVDGKRVAVFAIDPIQQDNTAVMKTPPIEIKAGPRRVAAAFVSKFDGPTEDEYRLVEQTLIDVSIALHSGVTALPHLQTFTIVGPIKVTGVSETPSRQKIFSCYPARASEEDACANKIMATLTSKAFRRPITAEEMEGFVEIYKSGRAAGDFESGIRTVVQSVVAAPEFVFRFEAIPSGAKAGESYRISDLELATRLSYFLWSTAPDEELIKLATQGKLRNDVVVEQQIRRMLADPRAETLSTVFAAQWLRLTGIEDLHPEPTLFPDFTRNLGQAMRREVELLFNSIVREDRNVLDLLTADYTFVNQALAEHYGIPNVVGTQFRRVPLNDPNRFGLLGKGGVLTMTSLANRTSPVARGKYLLEVLVGSPPPPPPPVVPPFQEAVNNEKVSTVRERLEMHRKVEPCASCHKMTDPIGLTMENFDAIGRWRAKDAGQPIDPSSELFDGTKLDGPISLRNVLLNRSEAFIGTFTENLLAYAVGRVTDYRDKPVVRSIARTAAKNNNHFSTFVLNVVKSAPFQMRTLNPATDSSKAERH